MKSRRRIHGDDRGGIRVQMYGRRNCQIVGREQSRHQIHRDEHRRLVERPAAEQPIERAGLKRAECATPAQNDALIYATPGAGNHQVKSVPNSDGSRRSSFESVFHHASIATPTIQEQR
jgi:hypothetical protein